MVKSLIFALCFIATAVSAQFTMVGNPFIDPVPCSYQNVFPKNRLLEGFDIKLTGFENKGGHGGTTNMWTEVGSGSKCNPAFDIRSFTTNKPPGSCDQGFKFTAGNDGVEDFFYYDFGFTNVLTSKTNYCSFYFMCTAVPASADYYFMSINDSDPSGFEGLRIIRASATTYQIRWAASATITLNVGTWYNVRMHFGPNGAGNSSTCYFWTGGNGGGPNCEPGSCNYIGAFSFDALKRNVRYLMFGAVSNLDANEDLQWVVDGVTWYVVP